MLYSPAVTRVTKFSFNFFCENFFQPTKMLTKTKIFLNFFREIRSKSYIFRKDTIFLMRNGKILIFIERKLNKYFAKMKIFWENEVENFRKIFFAKFAKFVRKFMSFRSNSYFFAKITIFLMQTRKITDFCTHPVPQ